MGSLIVGAVAFGRLQPGLAQDAYVVGVTAAITGPPAGTYAPAVEALAHLYRPCQRRRRRQRQEGPAHRSR